MGIEAELNWLRNATPFASVDLDADWRSINYCAIDVETTGLDLKHDEVISIGAVQIHRARVNSEENFYREVCPRRSPSNSSVRIHGLRAVDLEMAVPIESVIPDFAAQIGRRVLIAHAAWIERAFLKRHLRGTGLTFSKPIIDTAALARSLGYATDNNGREPSLELLARRLKLPAYAPHHALGDALTTAVIFLALATQLERDQLAQGMPILSLRVVLETSTKNASH